MKVSSVALGLGLAIPPISWFLSLEANFSLAPLVCSGHHKAMLYAVSAVALALALTGAGVSWFQRTLLSKESKSPTPTHTRNQGLAFAGIGFGVLFALIIAAQSIPNLLFSGCE